MAVPRVTLDVQALQSVAHAERGIGRYVASHANALIRAGAPIAACTLNPLLAKPARLPDALADPGLVSWATARVFEEIANAGPFVHHVMSPFEDVRPADGLVVPPAFRAAHAIAVTLYDVIPYVMADEYQRSWWNRQFLRRRAALVQSADMVCAISEASAREAIDTLGLDDDRVAVIGAAADAHFRPAEPGDDDPAAVLRRAFPALRRPFVCTVTGDDPRKDPLGLIDAYAALPAELRRDHQLVMTCTLMPVTERHWRTHAANRGLGADDVVLTGYVDENTLRALYQRARLFVTNSRREGFGLPVLEAAYCGCAAITADNSSLPEVLDEPESRFPTGDTGALTHLMERALTDDALRATLLTASERARGRHTWDAVAERTIAAYARIDAAPRKMRRSGAGTRVAIVGPFAPASSGVADYNERVAAALAPRCHLDSFAEVDPPYTRRTTAGRRFAVAAFDRTFSAASYDAVVYSLGNSRFHRATFEHARRYSGIVWLHDACLAGLYLTRAGLYLPGVATEAIDFDAAEAQMRDAVARCTGNDSAWLGADWWRPESYVDADVLMLEEVLRAARTVIVSSEEARRLVMERAPKHLPVHVLPLAVPDHPTVSTQLAPDDGPPWIVSLGVVSTVKRIDDLIHAFATLHQRAPARLAVVGNVDLEYANELRALARDLGVDHDVVVTGLVGSEEYQAWVERASVVVQLRTRSVGEGSATVTDALAAGKTVVTNVGSSRELPDNVVARVAADIDVGTLAQLLHDLVTDTERRVAFEHAARAYAQTHSFSDVARALLDIVAATTEPAFPAPLAVTA
ncbi:MAG: glycosyl transferase family 1 [Actinomycetia bacterium]|nr:glycosyl transferase family 1 [Actinomycetes bacterium]